MTWNLSPSGWPTWADPGSDMEFDLADRGYTVIDESDVQAAIDAFHAGLPPVLDDVVTVQELQSPWSPASVLLRAASVAAVEDADTVAPAGAWDFATAPTVAGVPLGSGGGGVKRVTMPIGADGSFNTVNGNTSICQRLVLALPATTTRWRLRVRNANPRTNTIYPGAITLTDGYVGAPTIATDGTWNGSFTAAPVQAFAGGDTPADGSEWVSAWVTASGTQFQADTPLALSWGFTCPSSQDVVAGTQKIANLYNGATAAAQVGNQAAPTGGTLVGLPLLDARLEIETTDDLPVVVVVGDSTASGLIDDTSLSPAVIGPWATWPGRMALAHRYLVINAGLGSAKYSDFATASSWAWQRFDLTTTPPDAAILACGINEAGGSISLATFMSTLLQTRAVLAGLGVQRFAYGTVINSPTYKPGGLAAGVAVGSTTLSTDASYAGGVSLSLDYGTGNAETVTTSGTSTGAGPYTTTITVATTKAHGVGAVVASAGSEQRRHDYNNALRLGKAGPGTLIEFADALDSRQQLRWYGTGNLHMGTGAWALLGRVASID